MWRKGWKKMDKETKKEPIKKVGSWIIPKTNVSFIRDDYGKLRPISVDMEMKQGHDWRTLPAFHNRVQQILNSLDGEGWE